MTVLVIMAVMIGLVATVWRAMTRFAPAVQEEISLTDGPPSVLDPDQTIRLITWNIGFAGLGREADFRPDGGTQIRARSRAVVEQHRDRISTQLKDFEADFLLVQELAHGSFLTRGVEVLGSIQLKLASYQMAYTPTVQVTGLPLVGQLDVGKATFSRHGINRAIRHALPTAHDLPGLTMQHFNVLESRVPLAGVSQELVLYNIHLAAFDDGALRRAQLDAVLAMMKAEYANGNLVIAGGDWNLRLADTEFPSTAPEKHRFWVLDLPTDLGLDHWNWAYDPTVPTCRTLEQPYEDGVNYTCVIDGFLVSPNLEIVTVEGVDLGFESSDHNPVNLQVRRRP